MILKSIKFTKYALLALPITLIFQPISKFLAFIFYYNKLILWIYKNKKIVKYKDFYTPFRNYNKRFELYKYVSDEYLLESTPINYFEFGVAQGFSFR